MKLTHQERDQLVLQYVPMVYKQVLRLWRWSVFRKHYGAVEDAVQHGIAALCKAADLYDPKRKPGANGKATFFTFATLVVRTSLLNDLGRQCLIAVPSYVTLAISRKGSGRPTKEKPEYIRAAEQALALAHLSSIAANRVLEREADESAYDPLAIETLRRLLDGLDSRTRMILERWFGIAGEHESLRRIGRSHGLSAERVRQIKNLGIAELRQRLKQAGYGNSHSSNGAVARVTGTRA